MTVSMDMTKKNHPRSQTHDIARPSWQNGEDFNDQPLQMDIRKRNECRGRDWRTCPHQRFSKRSGKAQIVELENVASRE
jgi:hypothetical protein